MHVVIAPDAFKGTFTAGEAAEALKAGWDAQSPGDDVRCLPLADGGAGTLQVLYEAAVRQADAEESSKPPHFREAEVAGPGGDAVVCKWLMLPNGVAAVELNLSSG